MNNNIKEIAKAHVWSGEYGRDVFLKINAFGTIKAIKPDSKNNGWISCKEQLPPNISGSVEYLVYETLNNRVQHDYWNTPDGHHFKPFWNHYGEHVTHWQPLPTPPENLP